MFGLGTDDAQPGEIAKDARPPERDGNTTERKLKMAAKKARDRIAQLYLGHIGNEETREIGRARIDWLAEDRPRLTTRHVPLALSWIRVGRLPRHSRAMSSQLGYNWRTSRRPRLTLGASIHRVRV